MLTQSNYVPLIIKGTGDSKKSKANRKYIKETADKFDEITRRV